MVKVEPGCEWALGCPVAEVTDVERTVLDVGYIAQSQEVGGSHYGPGDYSGLVSFGAWGKRTREHAREKGFEVDGPVQCTVH